MIFARRTLRGRFFIYYYDQTEHYLRALGHKDCTVLVSLNIYLIIIGEYYTLGSEINVGSGINVGLGRF